eukprot:5447209-Prymnesium_polylepis.1
MCKAWVTRAAAAAQRSLGTYKRPPECLMSSRVGPQSSAGLPCLSRSTYAGNTDLLKRGASATH